MFSLDTAEEARQWVDALMWDLGGQVGPAMPTSDPISPEQSAISSTSAFNEC